MTATAWHKSESGHWVAVVRGRRLEPIPLHHDRRRTGWAVYVDHRYRDSRAMLTQARSKALTLAAAAPSGGAP